MYQFFLALGGYKTVKTTGEGIAGATAVMKTIRFFVEAAFYVGIAIAVILLLVGLWYLIRYIMKAFKKK